MAGDGVHGADWGSVAAAGPGSDPGTVSVPDSRFSFRQRQRIRQPYGGPTLKQAADRTDQVATAAQQRQRIGGNQEWRCDSQAYGLWPHRCEAMDKRCNSPPLSEKSGFFSFKSVWNNSIEHSPGA